VHREHDYGSYCVRVKLLEPFREQVDLWFAVTAARCINEPAAWIELGMLVPFDPEHCRKVLEAREARNETNFRNAAYKVPIPPNKGDSTIRFLFEDVLTPLWHDRESLRPQAGETLAAYSDRLREQYRIGPFLAGQIVADLKHVPPLESASDWWDFAVPGPGSERGLNRLCKRPVNATWSEPVWLATLLRLRDETLAAANIAPLDAQNTQNIACREFDKYERAREKGGVPSRKYKPGGVALTAPKRAPKAPKAKPAAIAAVLAASEAADTACMTVTSPPLAPGEPLGRSEPTGVPDFITQDLAETPASTVLQFPVKESGQARTYSTVPPGGSEFSDEDENSSEDEGDTHAQGHEGKPFDDSHLLQRGYSFVRAFNYNLPDGTLICEQRRYELRAGNQRTAAQNVLAALPGQRQLAHGGRAAACPLQLAGADARRTRSRCVQPRRRGQG
jgi:hypothetical protein